MTTAEEKALASANAIMAADNMAASARRYQIAEENLHLALSEYATAREDLERWTRLALEAIVVRSKL